MQKKLTINLDKKNGISTISLNGNSIKNTISLADNGQQYLNENGKDIIIDLDKFGKLVNIELIGF